MKIFDKVYEDTKEKIISDVKTEASNQFDKLMPWIFALVVGYSLVHEPKNPARNFHIVYNETHVHIHNLYLGGK